MWTASRWDILCKTRNVWLWAHTQFFFLCVSKNLVAVRFCEFGTEHSDVNLQPSVVLKTSPVSCLIAAPVLAVLLLELSSLLNSDKIGGKANTRQTQPTLGEHSCIYFLHSGVSSASRWPRGVRSLCSCLAFAALSRVSSFHPHCPFTFRMFHSQNKN